MAKKKRTGTPRSRPAPPPPSRRRRVLVAVAALLALAALAAGLFVLLRGNATASSRTLAFCGRIGIDSKALNCYQTVLTKLVVDSDDPDAAVERITRTARQEGNGFLLTNCHGLMHAVGRAYVRAHAVTLGSLMTFLPRSNDPGCPAGFAHGMVTAVAPQIDLADPEGNVAVCSDGTTRYQRYSCIHGFGHAFMRLFHEQLDGALRTCDSLGPANAADCSQGAFHDYWFAISGYDATTKPKNAVTDPRVLCGEQAEEFVRPCWYRAFVDHRPPGVVETTADLDALCAGLGGVQREGCLTGASVIGPPDPRAQLALCSGFQGDDAVACVHGTKVQNLLGSPTEVFVGVAQRCDLFPEASTRRACYRWLGKVLAVITDGSFQQEGCPLLPASDAQQQCVAGARSMNDALVTFS